MALRRTRVASPSICGVGRRDQAAPVSRPMVVSQKESKPPKRTGTRSPGPHPGRACASPGRKHRGSPPHLRPVEPEVDHVGGPVDVGGGKRHEVGGDVDPLDRVRSSRTTRGRGSRAGAAPPRVRQGQGGERPTTPVRCARRADPGPRARTPPPILDRRRLVHTAEQDDGRFRLPSATMWRASWSERASSRRSRGSHPRDAVRWFRWRVPTPRTGRSAHGYGVPVLSFAVARGAAIGRACPGPPRSRQLRRDSARCLAQLSRDWTADAQTMSSGFPRDGGEHPQVVHHGHQVRSREPLKEGSSEKLRMLTTGPHRRGELEPLQAGAGRCRIALWPGSTRSLEVRRASRRSRRGRLPDDERLQGREHTELCVRPVVRAADGQTDHHVPSSDTSARRR